MELHVLPARTAGAAENMASDFLLLQRYPAASAPRFRHYGWRAPTFTFGYSQKIAFVRAQLPAGEKFDLCRRPTGGGIVDHRDDWTYSLVIPRGHPLEEMRATQSYRAVHEALAEALGAQAIEVNLKPCVESPDDVSEATAAPGVCFQRAEIFDVVHARTGEKIAGAAQKRNKRGLLVQGSIWRPAVTGEGAGGSVVDWDAFADEFAGRLATVLGASPKNIGWPEYAEDELSGLIEQYSAPEWIEYR